MDAPSPKIVKGPRKTIRKVGLGALMILIAAIAACLGAMRLSTGLGILALLIAAPAFLRTTVAIARRTDDGRPMAVREQISDLFTSMGIMLVVFEASLIAFLVACFPIVVVAFSWESMNGAVFALVIGGVAAVVAGFLVLRWAWPHKD